MTRIWGAGGDSGGKGGGGGSRTPTEAADSLDSSQYASVIDLLSEGEIQGLKDGHKSIFLNNTPLQNPDDSYNFKNVTIYTRNGTQDQEFIPIASQVEDEKPVNVTVQRDVPVIRSITDSNVDAVRITITIPQLQRFTDQGDIEGTSIELQIAVQYNGGGYTTVIEDTIAGRTNDQYQRDYLVNLNTIRSILTGTYSQTGTTVTVTTSTNHSLTVGAAFFADIKTGGAASGTLKVLNVISSTVFTYTATASLSTSGTLELNDSLPAEIRVTRLTADSTSSKLINAFNWTSYSELTYAKLRYPNSALAAIRVDAEQFSSIPQRSYLIRGIKVKIPNNATVDQTNGRLIYSGIWNGSFGAAQWTSDPAWILWDLLTSTRYGFGDHINAAQLDKWAFYSASQYCSELVPNGFGGVEPRFSCNVNIQTAEEAYKLINDMCSVFRAMPYWSTGSLTVSQDRPSDPVYLFTLANVTEDGFSYSGGSLKTRPNVAVVSYMDLTQRDMAYEVVEDASAIAKYGVVKTEISAFACTSRGQASRIGEWLLFSENKEAEVISFTASIDAGVVVRPGQVIAVSDPVRAGGRRGGRIASATTTAITVDNGTGLTLGTAPQLSIITPTGTVESRAVNSIVGNVITVASPFSTAPNNNSVWLYETSDIQTSLWRVLTVQEQDLTQYAITAIAYNSSKYDYIERGAPLLERDITNLNVTPAEPTNLQATETLYEEQGRAIAKIILSWRPVVGIRQYRVRWRTENGNWSAILVESPDYEIRESALGIYEFEVYSLSAELRPSVLPASLTFQAFGKTAPPEAVSGISLIPVDEASAILSWNRSTELDVLLGGKVLIRHSTLISGALWDESQDIVAAAAGSQTQKQVPLLEGTYLLKFEDDGGRRSNIATAAVVDLPTPQPRLLVQSYREDQESPPFSGNLTNMVFNTTLGGLTLNLGTFIDDLPGLWDDITNVDGTSSNLGSGEYEFGSTYDLNHVYDLNIRRYFTTEPYSPGNLWDDQTQLIDTWESVDGDVLDMVNAALYVRSTPDDPGSSPVWSDWHEFVNAIVRGRAFQFKTIATSEAEDQNIIIHELGASLELQQRIEQSAQLTSSASAYAVTFTDAFYQTPSLGITAYNMNSGDYFAITSETRTGFTVTFRDSGNNAVSRNFTYTAIGYGRQI
jgi:predicted phage tail protein